MQLAHLKRKVSVVHQHIDGAILLSSSLDHQINLISARYIGLKQYPLAARDYNFIKNSLRGFPVLVIVDDHRCTGLAQPLGRRGTYSPARAGNGNDPFHGAADVFVARPSS